MNRKKIGKRLHDLRLAAGETLQKVADDCGITINAVCQYESGARIPKDEIKIRLANHFDETVQFIFFD